MKKVTIFSSLLSTAMLVALATLSFGANTNHDWQIDPVHTSANFAVRHMMISNVRGNLGRVEGHVVYDGVHLSAASVTATIDAAAIDTHDAKRDEHLRSDQFLDTRNYPFITFKSTKLEKTSDGFDLFGALTIHGVTKQVVIHSDALPVVVRDPWGNNRIGISAHTHINRKDFGINYDKTLDNGGALVSDDVAIQLDVEMIQKVL